MNSEIRKARKELQAGITKKFGNLSRFSALSKIPYPTVYQAVTVGETEEQLSRVRKALEETENEPLENEVSDELIATVKSELFNLPNTKKWMEDNAVPAWWLKDFLEGSIRFKNKKVRRLLRLLELDE